LETSLHFSAQIGALAPKYSTVQGQTQGTAENHLVISYFCRKVNRFSEVHNSYKGSTFLACITEHYVTCNLQYVQKEAKNWKLGKNRCVVRTFTEDWYHPPTNTVGGVF